MFDSNWILAMVLFFTWGIMYWVGALFNYFILHESFLSGIMGYLGLFYFIAGRLCLLFEEKGIAIMGVY